MSPPRSSRRRTRSAELSGVGDARDRGETLPLDRPPITSCKWTRGTTLTTGGERSSLCRPTAATRNPRAFAGDTSNEERAEAGTADGPLRAVGRRGGAAGGG